jgi:hypothetical protein
MELYMKKKQKVRTYDRQQLSPSVKSKYNNEVKPLRILREKELKTKELPLDRPGTEAYQESLPEFKKLILKYNQ